MVPPLSSILNLSLQTSQIPNDWRRAIVTPVAKALRKAASTERPNFRMLLKWVLPGEVGGDVGLGEAAKRVKNNLK